MVTTGVPRRPVSKPPKIRGYLLRFRFRGYTKKCPRFPVWCSVLGAQAFTPAKSCPSSPVLEPASPVVEGFASKVMSGCGNRLCRLCWLRGGGYAPPTVRLMNSGYAPGAAFGPIDRWGLAHTRGEARNGCRRLRRGIATAAKPTQAAKPNPTSQRLLRQSRAGTSVVAWTNAHRGIRPTVNESLSLATYST
jgi:hypothetical protein